MTKQAGIPSGSPGWIYAAILGVLGAILGLVGIIIGVLGANEALAIGLAAVGFGVPLIILVVYVFVLAGKRRKLAQGLSATGVSLGLFGNRASGWLDGHRFRVYDRTIEVEKSVAHPTTLGRRELEEIARGEPSPRTGNLAVNPEHREAVAALVASGEETILFLDLDGPRFEGYQRGDLATLIRALIKLAGPGFIVARHEEHAVCPFCKETVLDSPRHCEACNTVHHDECFMEHGGCAVYGCERSPSGRRARGRA